MPHRDTRPTFGRRVRNIVNRSSETKFARVTIAGNLTIAANVALILISINQGLAVDERIGNKIRLSAIHARVIVTNPTPNQYAVVRCQIYKDKEGGITATPPQATINQMPDTSRFVVKFDKWVNLAPVLVGGQATIVNWSYHHLFPGTGQLVEFDGPLLTDATKGGWFLHLQTDTPADLALDMKISLAVYFKDA